MLNKYILLTQQVVLCLYSLGRVTQKHPEYTGPQIGPKMATKNERNFTEEQIRQGRDATIGLQSGTNVGASQAGHGGMGNTRHMETTQDTCETTQDIIGSTTSQQLSIVQRLSVLS